MKTRVLSLGLLLLFSACSPPLSPPPSTKRVEVKDTLHGVELTDPYRWLEDQDSAETRQWIDAQNAYAESIVGESERRARLRSRLGEMLRQPEVGFPRKSGDFEYFSTLLIGGSAKTKRQVSCSKHPGRSSCGCS